MRWSRGETFRDGFFEVLGFEKGSGRFKYFLGKQIAAHQSTGFERSETRDHGEIHSTPMIDLNELASLCWCFIADTPAPRHLFGDDPGHVQDPGPRQRSKPCGEPSPFMQLILSSNDETLYMAIRKQTKAIIRKALSAALRH